MERQPTLHTSVSLGCWTKSWPGFLWALRWLLAGLLGFQSPLPMCWGSWQQTWQIWAHLDSGSESLDLTPVTGESGGNAGARGGTPFRGRLREVIRGTGMTEQGSLSWQYYICLPQEILFRDWSCVHSLEAGDMYLEPWVTALFTPWTNPHFLCHTYYWDSLLKHDWFISLWFVFLFLMRWN